MGEVLAGEYTLLAVVGVGGAAAVFEARDASGATVAVKILHPHLRSHAALVRRFEREPTLLAAVVHPGVVPILAAGTDGEVPFLVMPLLQGETLETLRVRRGGALPVAEAARHTMALLDILSAVHDAGVVHRDVTPANVFCEPDGRLRLLDFGLAGRLDAGGDDEGLDDGCASEDGELLGTLAFMAPEQAAGRQSEVGVRSDLFAVGALLSKLVSGVDAHQGASKHERLLNAATRPVPKLTTRLPHASPELAALVDRALAFHPRERFANAASMRAALASLDAVDAASTPSPVVPARRPRIRIAPIVATMATMVAIAGLAWAAWPADSKQPRGDRAAREEPVRDAVPGQRERIEDRSVAATTALRSTTPRPSSAPTVVVAAERPDPMDIRR